MTSLVPALSWLGLAFELWSDRWRECRLGRADANGYGFEMNSAFLILPTNLLACAGLRTGSLDKPGRSAEAAN